MKLNESQLKQLITEEIIVSLLRERKVIQAERLLWESRQKQRLDEKWWKKLLGTWTPTDADIKDETLEDKLEDLTVGVIGDLRKSGRYSKKQAEDIVKRYLSGDPDLSRVDHKDLTSLFFKLNKDQAAEIEKLEAEEDADAPVPEKEKVKPDTPAQTVKDIGSLVRDVTTRKLLLRGLVALLTNDSVEQVLANLKPEQSKDAVLTFLKQIADMEPKALKKIQSAMHGKLFSDLMGGEEVFGLATSQELDQMTDPAATPEQQSRAAKTVKGAVGKEAGHRLAGKFSKLGLSEQAYKEIIKKTTIIETLNLYIEKRLLKQEVK